MTDDERPYTRAESVASGILMDLGTVPVTDEAVRWVAQRIEAYAARPPASGEAERLAAALDEACGVLDEPFHHDAISVNLREAAALLRQQAQYREWYEALMRTRMTGPEQALAERDAVLRWINAILGWIQDALTGTPVSDLAASFAPVRAVLDLWHVLAEKDAEIARWKECAASVSEQTPEGWADYTRRCNDRAYDAEAALGRVQALIETWDGSGCDITITELRAALRGEGAATPTQGQNPKA